MSETENTTETPEVTTAPATESTEPRPVLISRLVHVIGQFLSEHVDKPASEMSEELKHLFALFSQHIMLVNSINADPDLANKVVSAVDKEIQRLTEDFGAERKSAPVPEEPSNIITPSFQG
jgi:hypothetical protein